MLILPYGEAFPYEAFKSLKDYIFSGGGLFNVAGRPLWSAYKKGINSWEKVVINDPYKEFLSPLGIKYYETKNKLGLSVTTSIGISPVQPTHGNVFPYRIPAREFYNQGYLSEINDENYAILVKSWINPYTGDRNSAIQKW